MHIWLKTEWTLSDTRLKQLGFQQLQSDKYINIIHRSMNNITEKLNLGVHVDDILCLGTKNAVETWFHTTTLLFCYHQFTNQFLFGHVD